MIARLRHFFARLRASFRSSAHDADLRAELEAHLALATEEHVRRGLSPEAAARAARLELGGAAQLQEAHRELRGLPLLDDLLQDLRYAWRNLFRDGRFTLFFVLIVGLGLGASSVIFSLVHALLLRPLPLAEASRLAWIDNASVEGDLSGQTIPVRPYLDFRAANQSFEGIAAYYAFYNVGGRRLLADGEAERLTSVPISQNLLPILGVQPQLGRNFTEEECQQNLPVVLLTDRLWKRRFGGDPAVLGRSLQLNTRSVTVIGILPASFDFGSLFAPGTRVDLLSPFPLTDETNDEGNTLLMIGRLKPGVALAQAQAEASVLGDQLAKKHQRGEYHFRVKPLTERVSGRQRPALLLLSCAVGVVLLIMCANLSNLQLARLASRRRELAIRVALGASRGRLIRQLLTESLLLALCASLLGLGLALAGTKFVAGLETFSLPLRETVRFDAGVFAFIALLAIGTGLVIGLLPALHAPATPALEALKQARGSSSGIGQRGVRTGLVVVEVALTCVLLVGTGLLLRSFQRVRDVDLGFRPAGAAAVALAPQGQTQAERNVYFQEVLRLARTVPGVQEAGLTDALPLGRNRSWGVGAKGEVYSERNPPPAAYVRIVSAGYVEALGLRLRAGRGFAETDQAGAKAVVMLNQTLARQLWPGRDPLGQTVLLDVEREVVGVVDDVRHLTLEQEAGGEVFLPVLQTEDYGLMQLVVRTAGDPLSSFGPLLAALRPLEPNLNASELRPLQGLVDRSVAPRRFVVVLLGGFTGFVLLLASLGLYSIISHSVQARQQEIGIRLALGASAGALQVKILGHTLRLVLLGIGLGGLASWLLAPVLGSLLYGVSSSDPATFAAMAAVLTLVAAAAAYLPARRAARLNLTTVLNGG
ncbi:MAG: ABC transporter permease [Verrucomicrobia bacterium]|nr:ABC transporter permease [Verrucomicrobiota bacterium]